MKRIAAIRLRGEVKMKQEVEDTLKMLRLTRINHCSLLDDGETYSGMLRRVKDYITWGEVEAEDVVLLLRNRGELVGGEKLSDSYLSERTKFKSIEDFAQKFVKFEARLSDIPRLRPFFRLHPPRKGHEGIKRSIAQGGALGRRPGMKEIIRKMR